MNSPKPPWKAELDRVREQRTRRDPKRLAWDRQWWQWWGTFRARNHSPNDAAKLAYKYTRDQLGARPGPYPDGSDALLSEQEAAKWPGQ